MAVQRAWDGLTSWMQELAVLESVRGVVAWDQQTYLPPKGAAWRGEQSALLFKLAHQRGTDPRVGEWLSTLEAHASELNPVQAAAIFNLRRSYDRATCVPLDIVERLGALQSEGFTAWMKAKSEDDFSIFAPVLSELLTLMTRRAKAIDADAHPYETTLQAFDPGTTLASLRPMFSRLRAGLAELIRAVDGVALPKVEAAFPVDAQRALFSEVVQQLGYDFEGGRLDVAEHPFTIGLGPGDVRITTHLYERNLLAGLGGTVHEAGHGMYEQGLPERFRGMEVDDAASYGLHESQSRFWENFIGRSLPFFEWFEGRLGSHFPGNQVCAEDLYRAANRVVPGPIRVTADEVTYNLHIIVRFELEVALMEGSLAVADLPEAWNAKYEETLGIRPTSAAQGVLQDVHWSGGSFAYFPSYTLGNLYAASIGQALEQAQPDLWEQVRVGQFEQVLGWLRSHVHQRGHEADAPVIVTELVGERDHVEDLLSYLWGRHGALHGLTRPRQSAPLPPRLG